MILVNQIIVWLLLTGLFGLVSALGYLMILAIWGLFVPSTSTNNTKKRFVALIPVHNEENILKLTLQSLKNVDYPDDSVDVIFIADHCTDKSVALIREAGYHVHERDNGKPGKSHALAYGFAKLKESNIDDYDALVIFDADNLIDKDFYRKMASSISSDKQILQGNTGIANKNDSVFTQVNYINYAVTNRLKEHARSQAGLTCRLRGHGTVFTKALLDEINWGEDTLVEDQMMLLDMVLKGKRVQWVHDACVDSIIPATMKLAATQRRRWSGGKSAITTMAIKKLLRRALRFQDKISLDLIVDFMMPSYSVLIALSMAGVVFSFAALGMSNIITQAYMVLVTGWVGYYLLGAMLEGVPLRTFPSFFLSPFFILWRVWIFATSLRGAKKW